MAKYSIKRALVLPRPLYRSENEKATILSIYGFIQDELNERIDKFSQDVIILQFDVLLN